MMPMSKSQHSTLLKIVVSENPVGLFRYFLPLHAPVFVLYILAYSIIHFFGRPALLVVPPPFFLLILILPIVIIQIFLKILYLIDEQIFSGLKLLFSLI